MPEDTSLFWSERAFNGERIREYSREEGVNPRDFEKEIWAYDTLFILQKLSGMDLYFKGGTCVQTYLPLDHQRFSIDLDFNINTKDRSTNAILGEIAELNRKLEDKDLLRETSNNLTYGGIYPQYYDRNSGVITFARVFPSKTTSGPSKLVYRGNLVEKSEIEGIFNHILIQINLKHTLYAMQWNKDGIRLRIQKYEPYQKELFFKRLSLSDLFVDKIMALKNRREFRDLYDLGMMAKLEVDKDLCREKLDRILKPGEDISETEAIICSFMEGKEYLRYIHSLPKNVVPVINDRTFYTGTIKLVKELLD